jgi:hypothetical protein
MRAGIAAAPRHGHRGMKNLLPIIRPLLFNESVRCAFTSTEDLLLRRQRWSWDEDSLSYAYAALRFVNLW